MATHNFKRYVFNVLKRFNTTRHYQSVKELNSSDLLTPTINISVDRGFNNSKNIRYSLKLRDNNKWGKQATGLKITSNNRLYYGDIPKRNGAPQHLLIFIFKNGDKKVIIDVYKDFYPKNKELQDILHNYILNHL